MKITRNKIIMNIFAFLLTVNILIILNFNYFYLQTILAFVFLITVPGLLIMLMLRIRVKFWEYLVYTIGMSVAFIMFAGLFVNWTLPFLNITDKPLSLYPILICFDIILLVFMALASERNKDLNVKIKFPKFTCLDRIFIIIPMFFPFLAVVGAFILNNHGPNYVSMALLALIAVYVMLIVIFRNKLNENVFVWTILMISVSLLMVSWLRSWYISGIDINQEYSFFQLTKNLAYWSPANSEYSYNSMLSVTILPEILSLFLRINDQYIFKLIIPLIFSLTPIVVYLFARKYLDSSLAFLAAFFFVSQPVFTMGGLGFPIRQEIATIFFSLMLLVLFNKETTLILKSLLFTIFGFSMIVSHYSTTYIALAIFLISYIFTLFYKLWQYMKKRKRKIKPPNQKFHLNLPVLLLLFLFTFLWYSQLTDLSDDLVDFTVRSFSNIEKTFSEEVQLEGQSFEERFNIFHKHESFSLTLEDYSEQVINDYKDKYHYSTFYEEEKYKDYNVRTMAIESLPNRFNENVVSGVYYLREALKNMGELFIMIAIIYLLFTKKNKTHKEYLFILLSSIMVIIAIVILPFTSINYDLGRTYQQVLVSLSLASVLGCFLVFKFLRKNYQFFMVALFFVLYFLLLSKGAQQIVGGISDVSMVFNNEGFEYYAIYAHKAEILSGSNLFENYDQIPAVYIDNFAYERILLVMPPELSNRIVRNVFIPVMRKDAYVYVSYNNHVNKIVFKPHQRVTFSYNYPEEFLQDNKNKIYDNGGSEIFR